MKKIKLIIAAFDKTLDFLAILAMLTMVFTTVAVLIEIVMRYFLNKPQGWVLQSTEYSLVVITFLATAWVLKRGKHVRMDILTNRLSPRTRAIIETFNSAIGTVICLVLAIYGTQVTVDYVQRGLYEMAAVRVPLWPFFAIMSLGMWLLTMQYIRIACSYLVQWKSPKP